MLAETVHHLALSTNTRALWLLDNEAGLLDAYRLELSTKFHESFHNIWRKHLLTKSQIACRLIYVPI